jgi:hypothetical protein
MTLSLYVGLHAAANCLVAIPPFMEVSFERALSTILRIAARLRAPIRFR